jgi:hypothetical protein
MRQELIGELNREVGHGLSTWMEDQAMVFNKRRSSPDIDNRQKRGAALASGAPKAGI